jgi:hypothetical protein
MDIIEVQYIEFLSPTSFNLYICSDFICLHSVFTNFIQLLGQQIYFIFTSAMRRAGGYIKLLN